MKVLYKGFLPEEDKPWKGKEISCEKCHSRLGLENKDEVELPLPSLSYDFYWIICPVCKKIIGFRL